MMMMMVDTTRHDTTVCDVYNLHIKMHCLIYRILVLRSTTVLPRHRGTIFLRYQYRRLYGTF